MNLNPFLPLAAVALFSSFALAEQPKGFQTDHVVLYQTDDVLQARVDDVAELAGHFKKIQAACTEHFATTSKPENLDVIVAVRPGRHSRVWFISSTRLANAPEWQGLRKKLEALPACSVHGGPVAFAISGKIAGGDKNKAASKEESSHPIPKEWKDAAAGRAKLLVPDGYLNLVWPESDASANEAEAPAPEGFVRQILEPTGGKMLRPKDWFYSEGHRNSTYMWTISREDSSGNRPYTTGVRIQVFVGVKEHTGKTAKEFALNFIESKKKEATTKVIDACEPKEQGMFIRTCLETEEGAYHILYSAFWGAKDLDMAVITISGTTKELWDKFSPTFDKMAGFELIDMKRFEK